MRKRSTIKDIAAATGVSAAAVSAVLSGRAGETIRVSEETRVRIHAAARELGYVPDQRARSFRERRSVILSVITYEKVFPVDFHNEFYGFFVGIEEEAARRGYDILILNNKPDPALAVPGRMDQLGTSDGAVVIGISRDETSLARFLNSGFPIVFVGRREIAGFEPSYATFDYESPVVELVGRIAKAGLPGADFFAAGAGEPLMDKRRFLSGALADSGLSFREFLPGAESSPTPADLARSGNVLVFNNMRCADDFRAAARSASLEAGEDYQAVVLEDRWQDSDASWTRLDSDRVGLGRAAVSCLVDMIAETAMEPVNHLIPVRLIRGSSSPALFT